MKKILLIAASCAVATFAKAATVGWSHAGMTSFANDAYSVFVIGQNGVTDIKTVTDALDSGLDFSSYVFGSGTVAANGFGNVTAAASGKTLGEGTYTSFTVLFDSAEPTSGTSKYVVLSGGAQQVKSIGPTTTSITFAAGNVGSIVGDASNWKSFGSAGPAVPEPTSGLLLLLGMAGLALKRKVA